MTLNTAQQDAIIAHRRMLVGRLAVRHVTMREIVRALAEQGHVNPDTQHPWALDTIHKDILALKAEWRAAAAASMEEAQAAVLAEIRELRREAWTARLFETVLRAIKQETDLLGLDAPKPIDLTVRVRALAAALDMDEDEAVAIAEGVIRAHAADR